MKYCMFPKMNIAVAWDAYTKVWMSGFSRCWSPAVFFPLICIHIYIYICICFIYIYNASLLKKDSRWVNSLCQVASPRALGFGLTWELLEHLKIRNGEMLSKHGERTHTQAIRLYSYIYIYIHICVILKWIYMECSIQTWDQTTVHGEAMDTARHQSTETVKSVARQVVWQRNVPQPLWHFDVYF